MKSCFANVGCTLEEVEDIEKLGVLGTRIGVIVHTGFVSYKETPSKLSLLGVKFYNYLGLFLPLVCLSSSVSSRIRRLMSRRALEISALLMM